MSGHRKNGANGAHGRPNGTGRAPLTPALSPRGAGGSGGPPLDVRATLAGKTLLVTGATGFVGKVALTLLLDRYPEVGEVFVLVRPGTGGSAEARFFEKVVTSRPFDPLRHRHGDRFDAFVHDRCVPIAGDVSDPLLGISDTDLARLAGLDAVVNCAGLVDFDPSLELALGVNVHGARNAVELCRRTGAALLHMSTCFVAGNRDGVVYEDEALAGYFPRREGVVGRPKQEPLDAADFDVEAEVKDCEKRMAEVRERADDRVQQSLFRDRALERLREDGRAGDEKAVRLAVARERRLWISQRLVDVGMDRARHWGWPNTYTYTKSLGEQVIAASDVPWTLVRPSIVESALRYPFPGWNEGFTTSAPLAFLALKGARGFPAAEKAVLDVVPVDLVAAATLAATAELVERRDRLRRAPPGDGAGQRPAQGRVYHLASGDTNPLWARRAVELTALYRRRYFRGREEGNGTWNGLLSRIEPYAVTRTQYEAFGPPALAALSRGARRLIDELAPRWGAPRLEALAERARRELDELDDKLSKSLKLWDLFLPFVWENKYVFRCAAIRELYGRLSPADREAIPWDPDELDWRRYWLDVHMKGLEEWVFPGLEAQSGKRVHAPRTHRDLLELLEASCEQWKGRVALRMEGERKDRITYGELRRMAERVAGFLHAAGVRKGDRVLLASENRPEWAVAYFGILRTGATAVPVDPQLTAAELANLWKTAGAPLALVSDDTAERHPGLAGEAIAGGAPQGARAATLAEALRGGPPPPFPKVSPDDLASLIFTSGTTGTPKGVMLSHRNFASLVGKLCGTFDLGPGDGLLSVLPLHHTFEFTAGLLVPLARGAEIAYLDELTADRISDALSGGRVTAMIGVPALWSLLHRRITQELAARPGVVEGAFKALMKANAALRDSALAVNLGKLLFWPVHRKFGGRLRLLVSGGSALDPEVQAAFRELGFDLYEGYGLTEAAPVLAVSKPGSDAPSGSVGPALPGIELRIADPDASGVGEVLAKGPNVMLGYWRGPSGGAAPGVDPELTEPVLEDGWLRTGDLGKLDADGNLTLVGRKKDVIIDANGKNVHPDEVEDAYREPDLVKELCVVGLPDGTGEKVAMLVVPDWKDRDRSWVREQLEAHVRAVSAKLPFAKRVKAWHVFDGDLPKTATRKVKRSVVRDELLRIEAMAQKGRKARDAADRRDDGAWLLELVAEVSRRPRAEVTHETRLLGDLGFDSLMITELTAALEEAGVPASAAEHLQDIQTVGELARLVASTARRSAGAAEPPSAAAPETDDAAEIPVPRTLARVGRRLLGAGQRALYQAWYGAKVHGAAFVPHDRNFLVVANHASHLDMGLVKVALGDEGERLAALAARDYFFDTALKRAYFENFTNLIPMDREGSLRASLRSAAEALRRGYHLLIFPEGTRSRDGSLAPFFPTAGYLALHCGVDVLPAWLSGTHEALPPGKAVPRKAPLEVRFGPPIPVAELRRRTEGRARSEAYRVATAVMEEAVKALRDGAAPKAPPAARDATAASIAAAIKAAASGDAAGEPTATVAGPTSLAPARKPKLTAKPPEET